MAKREKQVGQKMWSGQEERVKATLRTVKDRLYVT